MSKKTWTTTVMSVGVAATLGMMASPIMVNAAATKPVTITIAFDSGAFSTQEVQYFEKLHPGIRINLVTYNSGALPAEFASGSAPDIIETTGSSLPSDVEKGLALNIQPYINKTKSVFNPKNFNPVVDQYRWNGKVQGQGPLYGLPKDWSPDFDIWVNKKVFKEAGVPLPSAIKPMTWNQVFADAKKITLFTGKGKLVRYGLDYYADGQAQPEYQLLSFQAQEQGVSLWSKDFSQAQFNNPKVMKILTQWVTAVKENIGPNSVNNDKNFFGSLFTSDKLGMMISGYWFSGYLRAAAPKTLNNYYMIPAPIYSAKYRMDPPASATGAYIWTGSKHKAQAWTAFTYFFGQKPVIDRAESGWGLPIFKNRMALVPQKTAWDKSILKVAKGDLKYADKLIRFNPYVDATSVNTVMTNFLTPVYYGKSTLQNAVQQIDGELNSLIQAGMSTAGN